MLLFNYNILTHLSIMMKEDTTPSLQQIQKQGRNSDFKQGKTKKLQMVKVEKTRLVRMTEISAWLHVYGGYVFVHVYANCFNCKVHTVRVVCGRCVCEREWVWVQTNSINIKKNHTFHSVRNCLVKDAVKYECEVHVWLRQAFLGPGVFYITCVILSNTAHQSTDTPK